ncbi:hypothetical protein KQI91_05160 [Blautia sp. MSJ-19]|nr:hypothetical protein [Blautia sp. MSJ-19]
MNYRLKDVVNVGDDIFYEYDFYFPDLWLPICNSPGMGVCGYEGSKIYPNQFETDKDRTGAVYISNNP